MITVAESATSATSAAGTAGTTGTATAARAAGAVGTTGSGDVRTEQAAVRRPARPRADALRNRERIVVAAREALVEHGPEVPLDEIARRARIGNATLYRHFADRRSLIHDVLLFVVTRTADHAARAAAAEGDPFAALCRFAHAAVDEKVGALCGLLVDTADRPAGEPRAAGSDPDEPCAGAQCPHLDAQCARLEAAVEGLMERARRAGRLRTDVTLHDLMVAVSQLTRPLPGVACLRVDIHRHLQLFLDGLRAAPAPTPLTSYDVQP